MLKTLLIVVSLSYFCEYVNGKDYLTTISSIIKEKTDLPSIEAKYALYGQNLYLYHL
jgi:hypothetical protein